jgi:AraC-like DNA-binding protein
MATGCLRTGSGVSVGAGRPRSVRPEWLFEFSNRMQGLMARGLSESDVCAALRDLPKPDSRCEKLILRIARTWPRQRGPWPPYTRDSNSNERDEDCHSVVRPSARECAAMAAIQTLRKESARRWTVETLVRYVRSNRTDLEATFRSLTGQSIHEYLSACRLNAAKRLLRTTAWTCEGIATTVGYSSKTSLHRNFRRHIGITPDEYRRGYRFARVNRHVAELILSHRSGRP